MLVRSLDLLDVSQIMQMKLPELLKLRPDNLRTSLDPDTLDHIFKECGALWQHSGDPKDPHMVLASGKCSDGFMDVRCVLKYATLCEIMAAQIADRIIDQSHMGQFIPDWVIGSDQTGAVLAFEVARQLGVKSDFTQKGIGQKQIWKQVAIKRGEWVVQVEGLVTSLETLSEVRKGLVRGNPEPIAFMPYVFALVNQSTASTFENVPLYEVRSFNFNTWNLKDCPLCAAGSERIYLKTK
ncbi:hypothetical protein A2318_02190 [Candidatus Uhrbacteria bacterium RIFOXYB2_FULL_45_11]|uniref:Orotate phosphoribosyltransferase n=1 Tax=Candidatus Uhrbacteria bacterium RIFOXYB2_FULL_45_11 TaxID=1802421 RepID=A0A1F7WAM1_9BACT|nr:MAG: hypothetical protein A2318_02190 [Candidatus Uhrbacteria bacterium RIFOXYB2_FULL_45_11]